MLPVLRGIQNKQRCPGWASFAHVPATPHSASHFPSPLLPLPPQYLREKNNNKQEANSKVAQSQRVSWSASGPVIFSRGQL